MSHTHSPSFLFRIVRGTKNAEVRKWQENLKSRSKYNREIAYDVLLRRSSKEEPVAPSDDVFEEQFDVPSKDEESVKK